MNLLADYGWFWWIVVGAVAGLIAKLIMPGRDPGGCIVTIVLGIAGAALGGFLAHLLKLDPNNTGGGFIAAIIGAIVILFIYRLVVARRR